MKTNQTTHQITHTSLSTKQIQNIKTYTNIGFCQPKFYTTTAWNRAKKCVERLCELGYAKPYDYGWGKGKYDLTEKGKEIGLGEIYKVLVNEDFKLVVRDSINK